MTAFDARYWIHQLQLLPHPEGGFYREVYRSSVVHKQADLPAAFGGDRVACTSIYYLLEAGDFSAFHRIASDELWHFYAGDPLEVIEIDLTGKLTTHLLGNRPDQNQRLQTVIPAGHWFASRPAAGAAFSLVGCTVSPGFDFEDFEMASSQALAKSYPQHATVIASLTRNSIT